MTMESAVNFLIGSILTGLGFMVLVFSAVVINNLISKYWKPIRIFTADSWNINPPLHYEDNTPPKLEPVVEKQQDKK